VERRQRSGGPQKRRLDDLLGTVASEWKGLSAGELVFVGVVGLGIFALWLSGPADAATGLLYALFFGLLAGVAIAVSRKRRAKSTNRQRR
jgi:hypothetical protein